MSDTSRAPAGTVVCHFLSGQTPDAFSDDDVADINELLSVLSPESPLASKDDVFILVRRAYLYVARIWDGMLDRPRIIGMATLTPKQILSGRFGIIDDVVVHPGFEGNGTGKRIVGDVIAWARKFGLSDLDLTSRPGRDAANHLYQKLGFELRATNCYRKKL